MKKTLVSTLLILGLIAQLSLFAAIPAFANLAMLDLTTVTPVSATSHGAPKLPSYNENGLGGAMVMCGYPVEKGIVIHPTATGTGDVAIEYDISGYDYDTLVVNFGKVDNVGGTERKICFSVFGDGAELATSGIVSQGHVAYFACNVKGVKTLKLAVNNGGDTHNSDGAMIAYPTLINKADLKIDSVDLEGVSFGQILNKDIDYSKARIRVTYNTGNIEFVEISKAAISGFDKTKSGAQTLTVEYSGVKGAKKIYVQEAADMAFIENMTVKEVVNIKDMPLVYEKDFDGKTEFAIGGQYYPHSLALHPNNTGDFTSFVTFDIDGKGYTRFHAVAGKTLSNYQKNVTFIVYADGVEVAKAENLPCGAKWDIDIDITNVKELKLAANQGDDGYSYDASAFADAVFYKECREPETTEPTPPSVPDAPSTGDAMVYFVIVALAGLCGMAAVRKFRKD